MKTLIQKIHHRVIIKLLIIPVFFFGIGLNSCNDDLLDQVSKSNVSDDAVFSSRSGFEASLVGLTRQFREEWQDNDNATKWQYRCTDMFNFMGAELARINWLQWWTPVAEHVEFHWTWAYTQMIPLSNNIITHAEKPENSAIWEDEADKNSVIAEARFFRAWTYNILANLYGGVPIVDKALTEARFDFVRATREEVYEFARADLEFASQWLPETTDLEGRVVKAAADHLLAEVYISLGQYDNAITSASEVINSSHYQLMTERFGNFSNEPGDPFSDLFLDGNFNRSSGNQESILVWQIDDYTVGGTGSDGRGNNFVRKFAPFTVRLKDPSGFANVVTDSLGRGVGEIRGSNYTIYDIWRDDWNDMRNSIYNMRRDFYYNNPNSPEFGTPWDVSHMTDVEDTMRSWYPYTRKVDGVPFQDHQFPGRTRDDWYVMRLAETYLLRAEAHHRNGDNISAAADINVVRDRANAINVDPADVDLDYILDERARELMAEEPRMRTLIRMNKLVERVRLYDIDPMSRSTVQDFHNLWPIPQKAIDSNVGAELKQNPGYSE